MFDESYEEAPPPDESADSLSMAGAVRPVKLNSGLCGEVMQGMADNLRGTTAADLQQGMQALSQASQASSKVVKTQPDIARATVKSEFVAKSLAQSASESASSDSLRCPSLAATPRQCGSELRDPKGQGTATEQAHMLICQLCGEAYSVF